MPSVWFWVGDIRSYPLSNLDLPPLTSFSSPLAILLQPHQSFHQNQSSLNIFQGGQTTVLRKVKKNMKEKTSLLKSAMAACNTNVTFVAHVTYDTCDVWHAHVLYVTMWPYYVEEGENMWDNIALKHVNWYIWCDLPWQVTSWYLISYNQSHKYTKVKYHGQRRFHPITIQSRVKFLTSQN